MSGVERERARFIVGIDLGTSNTAVAYVALSDSQQIRIFPIEQLVAPGEVAARPLLPSFRYHPAEGELSAADLQLAAAAGVSEPAVIGSLAQTLGGRVPGRLVASAKSWLCHVGVDRRAAILQWGAPQGVSKVSPVAASASYLMPLRAAWDGAQPDAPLHEQEIVLTVPASFDEGARALTLEAAQQAGLPSVRLLEEPQAALYDFIDRRRAELEQTLANVKLVLVLDVGGGTTDLTLVRVELRESGLRLTRIAVGDHLMLGGDNMDHALARLCEPALSGGETQHLPAARFAQLIQQCRVAKERLLSENAPEQLSITLLGTGSSVVAGKLSTSLTRTAAEHAVVDGFFPVVSRDAQPNVRRGGLVEFGLPFASDPVITRHVAAFLSRQAGTVAEALQLSEPQLAADPALLLPDAVLLNGGVFRSSQLQKRMLEVLQSFRGAPLSALENPEPELAVARGAAAYGLARRGVGLKIGGGSARSYYLLVKSEQAEEQAVCVLPRGAEEGEPFALPKRTFALRLGEPVRFRLLSSTSEKSHRPGDLLTPDDNYQALPDIAAVIEAKGERGKNEELRVELEAQLTEVGTLEMSLLSVDDRDRRYRLEFQVRAGQSASGQSHAPARVTQLHPRWNDAVTLLQSYYGKAQKELAGRKILTLRQDLEKLLGDRATWDTPLLRELFGQLSAAAKRRRRSADHERLWFHLVGYCLRPGFGYPVDPWRVEQTWPIYAEGVQFTPDPAVWAQYWILWRRIAGGLDEAQHQRIYADLRPWLEPPSGRPKQKPKGPRPQGLEDMVRLAASLERLSAANKSELGGFLLARLAKGEISEACAYWSFGRLGARAPFYGSAHHVVDAETAAAWLERLLPLDLRKHEQASFAIAQLARLTHDRARDLPPELRERAAGALERVSGNEPWVKLIRMGGELEATEANRVFGETLPPGLRLI
jgi:molecular chaperone DnaK (HSP70)